MKDPGDPRVVGGDLWSDLLATLDRARGIVLADDAPQSPRDRAEGFRYLLRYLAAGHHICVEHADPDYPRFARTVDITTPWGLDAPDCLYLMAPIRGDATYRIHGNRGSANHIEVQANFGHFAEGDIAKWGTISSRNGLELDVGPSGEVEIVLGPEPAPSPPPSNWLPLRADAGFVFIRQYFDDWETERPADLIIDRIGATYPPPPLRTDQLAARVDRLRDWIEKAGRLWDQMSRVMVENMPPNSLTVMAPRAEDAGGALKGQAYGMGNFHCAPDDAVIVELAVPRCRQWSVGLGNWWWESVDFQNRQASLNGAQARIDPDGVFRGVIAHDDPGVWNWIDTAGYTKGTLAARFLLAESAPKVTMTVVPRARLRERLPADTPRVTPGERSAALTRRRDALWRRYRR